MEVIVTGSNGFVGKNLVEKLKEMPDVVINKLVRSKSKNENDNRDNEYLVDYNDIGTLLECKAFDKNIDFVFHIAGITKGRTKQAFWDGNVRPTINLLETLKRKNIPLKRFVYISSHAAAGPSDRKTHYKTECEKQNPIEFYGMSKFAAEEAVRSYSDQIPFTIIRPGAVYGPYDKDFLNIYKMTKSRLNIYPANKNKFISFIFIKDLIDAAIDASLSKNTINKTYFICNHHPASWKEIHERIFKIAQKTFSSFSLSYGQLKILASLMEFVSLFSKEVPILNRQKLKLSYPDYWIASSEQAHKDFGFSPTYSLEEGLKVTYNWYKKMGLI
ncbi:MAG: NAD(P)-dependent oxidoreductase [Bacteroidota bacterium]|nr:NAD(P)-dependent oxidoreductase [Bacteroidota bacterium]